MHADKAFLQVSLVADEQQPHVQLTVFVDAVGVVERPAQDQVGLGLCSTRVGQADVGIELGQLAFRVLAVVRDLGFMLAVHGRARGFDTADDAFLFLQRGAIPALDKVTDDAHGLVTAMGGPGRFVAGGLYPDDLVHGLVIVGVGVGRAIAKAQEVARTLCRFAGLGRCLGRHAAFLLPAHQQQVGQVFDDVAQRVDIGVRRVGAELQAQVAVTLRRFQCIVGKADHATQALGLGGGKAEAFVEQRLTDRYCNGQVIRCDHRAKDAGIGGRQFRVDLGHGAAGHQKCDALVEGAEQTFQVLAVAGQYIERHDHAAGRARGDDAALVLAEKRLVVLGLVTARCGGDLLSRCRHRRAAQAAAGNGRAGGRHAQQDAATLEVKLFCITHVCGRLHCRPERPRAGSIPSSATASALALSAICLR